MNKITIFSFSSSSPWFIFSHIFYACYLYCLPLLLAGSQSDIDLLNPLLHPLLNSMPGEKVSNYNQLYMYSTHLYKMSIHVFPIDLDIPMVSLDTQFVQSFPNHLGSLLLYLLFLCIALTRLLTLVFNNSSPIPTVNIT